MPPQGDWKGHWVLAPLLGTGHVDNYALLGERYPAREGRAELPQGGGRQTPERGTPLPWRKPLRPLVRAPNSTPHLTQGTMGTLVETGPSAAAGSDWQI